MSIVKRETIKKALLALGIEPRKLLEGISMWSIRAAVTGPKAEMVARLRAIVPDISDQESSEKDTFNDYWEMKRRALQAFQCSLLLEFLDGAKSQKLTVVDIGDSAGTHMLYLKEMTKGRFDIDTISVNLDPRAIAKIKARGLKAMHCRAEELDLGGQPVDFFTSFQMIEHLHNPVGFLRRLATKSKTTKMVITVPFLRASRVGLHHVRWRTNKKITAEEEHVFELSPQDWTLLFMHAGWKVVFSRIHYQYPRCWPGLSRLLRWFWTTSDYEGFWGAVLEKDTSVSDLYQDWEE
jgi:hypothetical protein